MFTGPDFFARHARRRRRAFTLVELVLALAILMMLSGVLFAIVDSTLRAASALRERQERTREVNAFLSMCRKVFQDMPGTVSFEARVIPDGKNFSTGLVFRNAPGLLWWGNGENTYTSTVLGARTQVGGLAGIGMLQDSEEKITDYLKDGKESAPWLILLPDLRDVQWRFYDPGSATWIKEWNNTAVRPTYVELTLATAEETHAYVFRVPPVASAHPVDPNTIW